MYIAGVETHGESWNIYILGCNSYMEMNKDGYYVEAVRLNSQQLIYQLLPLSR